VLEIERAFAVLDNVCEGDKRLQMINRSKSKSQLNPSQNPFIDNEATEARESDSDLADEESFDCETSLSDSDATMGGLTSLETGSNNPDSEGRANGSDLSISTQELPTLYDNYSASRAMMEAQIQKEQFAKDRYQFCSNSSDDTNQDSSSNSSDDSSQHSYSSSSTSSNGDSKTDMELEASFSSVVLGGATEADE